MKIVRHTIFFLFAPLALAASAEERGKHCERLAQDYYEGLYGRNFIVLTNIDYTHENRANQKPGHILGELDIVVLERRSRRLVDIAEVKCATLEGLGKAQEKAFTQLERFAKFCFKEKKCKYWRGDGEVSINVPWSADDVLFRVMAYVDDQELVENEAHGARGLRVGAGG